MKEIIYFYNVNDKFGEFSNFAKYSIDIKGISWPTSEHYFQAMKFESRKDQKEILTSESAMQAARKGRSRKRRLRADWESVKDDVMRTAVYAKFTQHGQLKRFLLGTEDAILVEHTGNDSYWGDGGDGRGKNMLGKILMETREKLNSA